MLNLVRDPKEVEVRDESNDRHDCRKGPQPNAPGLGLRDSAPRRQELVPVDQG